MKVYGILFFPYFDCLHSDFRFLRGLLQKRSYCLLLLLHFTYIFCRAEELQVQHMAHVWIIGLENLYTNYIDIH